MKLFRVAQVLASASSLPLFANAATQDPCELAHTALSTAPEIPAVWALDCLKGLQLDRDLAKETLQQLRLFMQFYSAQAYFAKPPTAKLELVPVELNKTLDTLEANLAADSYKNFYSFHTEIYNLFGLYRDGHVNFLPGCLAPFAFVHDYPLISLASSPDQVPQIYFAIFHKDGTVTVGDRVAKINDLEPGEFLTKLANTLPGLDWVDPDARYNDLLVSMRGGSWRKGKFAQRLTLEDSLLDLKITAANGTTTKVNWGASINGFVPDSDVIMSTKTFTSSCYRSDKKIDAIYHAYDNISSNPSGHKVKVKKRELLNPNLRVRKEEEEVSLPFPKPWKTLKSGEFAVYHLDEHTAVLTIRSFDSAGTQDADEFILSAHNLVKEAIKYLTANGYSRLIVDVTGNGGGYVPLGIDTVRQLFPDKDHFFAVNMRWNPALSTMLTQGKDSNGTYWDYRTFNDEKGGDVKSMQELLAPTHRDNDWFTPIVRSDVVDSTKSIGVSGSDPGARQPFETKNILLLSSGTCGSTCAIFSEALQEVGVPTVVFGGRPKRGPMQLVGGIKGSQVLEFDEITSWASYFLGANSEFFASVVPRPFKINLLHGGINFQNSWRKGKTELPIEFLYDPADYRLAYTAPMAENMTVMWEAARDVVWGDKHDDLSGSEGGDAGSWKGIGGLIWTKIRGGEL